MYDKLLQSLRLYINSVPMSVDHGEASGVRVDIEESVKENAGRMATRLGLGNSGRA